MGGLVVRREEPPDFEAISRVVAAAFGSPAEARLVQAIRESESYLPDLSLVAEVDGEIAGHVMISYVELDAPDGRRRIASLSPLAVAPEMQGRGIGSALVATVTRAADERGEPAVVLEGSPRYYGRLGFEQSVPHGVTIELPTWAPPEAAQIMRLGSYHPDLAGRVVYPPAFDVAAPD